MVTVKFRRRFTSGTLVGLRHDDRLSFPDMGSARRWVAGVELAIKHDLVNYDLEDVVIWSDLGNWRGPAGGWTDPPRS